MNELVHGHVLERRIELCYVNRKGYLDVQEATRRRSQKEG